MQSKSITLATAIAELIEQIDGAENAEALMTPDFDLDKLSERKICCWVTGRESEVATRATQQVTYSVAVAILQRLTHTDNHDELKDELLSLAEQIGDELLGATITTVREFKSSTLTETGDIVGYEHTPLFDRDLLEMRRIFATGITLQFIREETFNNRS